MKLLIACIIQLVLIAVVGFVAYRLAGLIGGWAAWLFTYLIALFILTPISFAIVRRLL